MTSNYVTGRAREIERLSYLRKTNQAVLGGRFRGSKISKGWIKHLGFNPKIDLWWIDRNGITHFEQFKSAQYGKKAYIGSEEKSMVQRFAHLFKNYNNVWVGIVKKEWRKEPELIRLN